MILLVYNSDFIIFKKNINVKISGRGWFEISMGQNTR